MDNWAQIQHFPRHSRSKQFKKKNSENAKTNFNKVTFLTYQKSKLLKGGNQNCDLFSRCSLQDQNQIKPHQKKPWWQRWGGKKKVENGQKAAGGQKRETREREESCPHRRMLLPEQQHSASEDFTQSMQETFLHVGGAPREEEKEEVKGGKTRSLSC